MKEEEYERLKRKIRQLIHIDLNNYKSSQMKRRLEGFISHTGFPNIEEYCQRLDRDLEEVARLRSFLTINVTEFYRDQKHFETLRKVILPELQKNTSRLNIWSAGCSDGEEPYSIAVMLDELSPGVKHRILATDLDEESLSKAVSGGPYQTMETRNLPQPLLQKYFSFSKDGYWINERIRDRVIFYRHDLTQDLFPSGLDLIICRNVTIYFSNEAKTLINTKFLRSLKEGGVLFIGATETMLNASEIGFRKLSSCFYQKNTVSIPEKPKVLTPSLAIC
jgi:chemotaxis protein methyltransferase CheR